MTKATGEARGTVALIDGGYDSYEYERDVLSAAGYDLIVFDGDRHDVEGKLAFARRSAGIFVRWTELDAAVFEALPALRCVVRYGAGYDNVDVDAATKHGVLVSNVQGYANHSVSDHALALILSCVRGLTQGARELRENYGEPPRADMRELKDMTLGIVGLGRIGGTLCQKARGLFRRTLACDPYIPHERFRNLGAIESTFETVLSESDVITIHCNLTDETRLLFSKETLAKMRPAAILVNTARGPVVDEEALLEALNNNALYAAGLDVWWDEPPLADRDELLAHPRVAATGHYAWYSTEAHVELQRRAAHNMVAMLRGAPPEDCLNARAVAEPSGQG